MNLPHWLVGEDLSEPEPIDSYLVGLQSPVCVAKVTQKRGWKVMLTLPSAILNGRLPGERQSELWFARMEEGAHYWAGRVLQDEYRKKPPEILEREDLVLPRFLLCDDSDLKQVFVVHTGEPFMVVEVLPAHLLELVMPAGPLDPVKVGLIHEMKSLLR